jgi:outer membrane lipoprotein-sorting protein
MCLCQILALCSVSLLGVQTPKSAEEAAKPTIQTTRPAGQTLEAVEKKIIEKWSRHKSLSVEMRLVSYTPGFEATGKGTCDYVFKDGKEMYRTELTTIMAGQETTMRITNICDGEFLSTLTVRPDLTMAVKRQGCEALRPTPSGKTMLKTLRQNYELSLEPDQKVHGRDTFVIRGRNSSNGIVTRLFVDQQTGLVVRAVYLDPAGSPIKTIDYTEVKFGVEIKPERFILVLPPGVELVDKTN